MGWWGPLSLYSLGHSILYFGLGPLFCGPYLAKPITKLEFSLFCESNESNTRIKE
jgi:hypothetical protein